MNVKLNSVSFEVIMNFEFFNNEFNLLCKSLLNYVCDFLLSWKDIYVDKK